MATPQENLARFQEIANRGLQDKLDPDKRARFDESIRRGLISLPGEEQPIEQPQEQPSTLDNLGRAAVKGASATLAFPAEIGLGIAKGGIALSGSEGETEDFINNLNPTEAIQSGLSDVGVRSDPNPEGVRERFATNATEALSGGFTGLGVARTATKGLVGEALKGNVKRFATEEAAAAGVGAGARTFAEEAGFGEGPAAASEIGASIIGGGFVSRVNALRSAASKAGKAFSEKEQDAAARVLQSSVTNSGENVDDVVTNIQNATPEEREFLNSGALSDSPALTSLVNSVIKNNLEADAAFARSKKSLNDFIKDDLAKTLGADDSAPVDFIDNVIKSNEFATQFLEKGRQAALQQAARDIADFPPDISDFATPVQDRLASLVRIDRDLEKELWGEIDQFDPVGTGPLSVTLSDIMGEAKTASINEGLKDFPSSGIRATIEEFTEKGATTVDEILDLKSVILDRTAEARLAGNDSLARRLSKLTEAVLTTLDGASGPNGDAIKQARSFSRDLNERFTHNTDISKVLVKGRNGETQVPGREALERFMKKGVAGQTSIIALKNAFGEVPKDVKNFVMQKFYREALTEDGIDVKKAEKFMNDFRELLDESELSDIVSANILSARQVDDTARELAEFTGKKGKSAASQLLLDNPNEDNLVSLITEKIKSAKPTEQDNIVELFNLSVSEPTGEALMGLKSATTEAILRNIFNENNDQIRTSLPTLKRRVSSTLEKIPQFDDSEIERVETLMNLAIKQSRAENARNFKTQSNTASDIAKSNSILGNILKLGFLKKVAPALNVQGGGQLAAASFVGRVGQSIGDRLSNGLSQTDAKGLIAQAALDGELMEALLKRDVNLTVKDENVIKRALKFVGKTAARTVGGSLKPSQIPATDRLTEDEE